MNVYRSLGEPVIQPQDLILATLQMITVSEGSLEDTTIDAAVIETVTIDTTPIDGTSFLLFTNSPPLCLSSFSFLDSTQDAGSNFPILKSKLVQSTRRYNAVKFGMPFTKACIPSAFVSEPDQKRAWPTIDPDKASYFKNLLEIHRKDAMAGSSISGGVVGGGEVVESKDVLEVSYMSVSASQKDLKYHSTHLFILKC